ncbi:MAG: pyrimidine 5'-nucleotidase [Proteobacteria bacterium CG1_02_64_396]|nr:MAG: pyrimidine 5'-nucleotidase [Proteobacteria bacterium CG1_02_64_396]
MNRATGLHRCLPPQPVWLIDLDNTLYSAHRDVFPAMDRKMTAYIMALLSLDAAAANALRQRYWVRYGTTLKGLMRHHRVDPDDFLHAVHDIPLDELTPDGRLRAVLNRLPGARVLYTNASMGHARRVLHRLGVTNRFTGIVSIETLNYEPKPHRQALSQLLAGLPGGPKIMVEDSLANLKSAKQLGIKTVWVAPNRGRPILPPWVDRWIPDIYALPRIIPGLVGPFAARAGAPPRRNGNRFPPA